MRPYLVDRFPQSIEIRNGRVSPGVFDNRPTGH
jgi:hypothetical protein